MAWNKTKPNNANQIEDDINAIRANFEAIEAGTDAALKITNAKVAADAGIVDTKLAQITTAGKVSGTALTGLANTPSGAGVIPAANIPNTDGSKLTGLANTPAGAGVIPIANVPTSGFLLTTGDQSVAGVKTFTSFPVTPSANPTADYQTSNKKYVDDKVAAGVAGSGFWHEMNNDILVNTAAGDSDDTFKDLSTGIGASALCFFRVTVVTRGGSGFFKMKRKGDATAYSTFIDPSDDNAGCNVANFSSHGDVIYMMCPCDSAGKIQTAADNVATSRFTIRLMGYIK